MRGILMYEEGDMVAAGRAGRRGVALLVVVQLDDAAEPRRFQFRSPSRPARRGGASRPRDADLGEAPVHEG